MDETIKKVEEILKENVIDFKLCSRLTWRNEVYYCRARSGEYAVKIYINSEESKTRSSVEYEMYEMLPKLGFLVPKVFFFGKVKDDIMLICKWINGKSLKTIVSKEGADKHKNEIDTVLNKCKIIWNKDVDGKLKELLLKNINETSNTPSMIYTRLNIKKQELFDSFKEIISIDQIQKIYEKEEEIINKGSNLINSDFSLHEVIYSADKEYWIDFETYTLGNINNDLAGIFYSLSNSLIDNKNEIESLYNILRSCEFYKNNEFVFYLIERVLCANYLCKANKKELDLYIDFILKIYK